MLRTVGLSFEDQVPVITSDPNRADIALFVGFVARRPDTGLPTPIRDWLSAQGWDRIAAQRPPAYDLERLLNVPVPIDNWQVFDHLFKWDQPFDIAGTRANTTLFGAAIRSFFAQGGRKCYVVRAGEPIPPDSMPVNRQQFIQTWIGLLIPGYPSGFDGSPVDPTGWRGMAHLFGLPDVSFLSLPDLPSIVRVPGSEVSLAFQPTEFPQGFIECSEGEETIFLEEFHSPLNGPRCDRVGYAAWARAVSLAASVLINRQREVQLVTGIPVPQAGEAAQAHLLKTLLDNGRGPLSAQPDIQPDGIASAFVQLAYPWLRTSGSRDMPEGLENPEGVLTGILARNALGRGAYFSAAGMDLGDVFEVFPLLSREQMYNALPVVSADHSGVRSLIERVTLFGPTPVGLRLLSDVTTASSESYRPASINRLMSVILRTARRLGEALAFESSAERLWEQTRDTLSSLMLTLFEAGALRGTSPDEAFIVRCDQSTMTQADIDSGRVIAQIQFDAAAPVERITVVLAINEGGQVSLVAENPQSGTLSGAEAGSDQVFEVVGSDPLSAQVVLTDANRLLNVVFDDVPQLIALPTGSYLPMEVIAAINARLAWGYARLSGDQTDDPSGHVVIGIGRLSKPASIAVQANPTLGFATTIQVKSAGNYD